MMLKRSLQFLVPFVLALLSAIAIPGWAADQAIGGHTQTVTPAPLIASLALLDQGTQQYDAGQYDLALATWQKAEQEFIRKGDKLNTLRSRINQAQAQKALGFYREAVKNLENLNQQLGQSNSVEKAQVLRSLGEAYLSVGNLSKAEETLKQSQELAQSQGYTQELKDSLLTLGLVERAKINRLSTQELSVNNDELEKPLAALTQFKAGFEAALGYFDQAASGAPNRLTQLQAELNQVRLLVDGVPRFNQFLLAALNTFTSDRLTNLSQPLLQSFFNDPTLRRRPSTAKSLQTQAQDQANLAELQGLKSEIVQRIEKLLALMPQIRGELERLAPSQAAINAHLNFAQSLTRLAGVANSASEVERKLTALRTDLRNYQQTKTPPKPTSKSAKTTRSPQGSQPPFLPVTVQQSLRQTVGNSTTIAANLLKRAIVDAQTLKNSRAESVAVVALAELYATAASTAEQWADVEALAKRALSNPAVNAPEIAYRAQKLMGRAFKGQGKIQQARAAYLVAARNLQLIRGDLVAVDSDIQYNFRDSVEPVYREAIAALLPAMGEPPTTNNLEEARQFMESLQLAELDNFLREACVEGKKVAIDQIVDTNQSKTAVIYPITLDDGQQLRLIAKIPGRKDLFYYPVPLPADKKVLEATLKELRTRLIDTGSSWRSSASQVYDWVIRPLEDQLPRNQVDTLVFVPDENFRNIPMAALYDSQQSQFLIQKYAVAISPGLQLLTPKPIVQQQLNVLVGGKSKFSSEILQNVPEPVRSKLGDLKYVKEELERIKARVAAQELFEQDFNKAALEKNIGQQPYNVVHLATHGIFGYRKEETYIVADDGIINVDQLSTLLRSRDRLAGESLELLVLSACQTAQGNNRVTLGLAGIAIRAGARSTLGSLWNVNDQSTTDFMDNFYGELIKAQKNGLSKAKALQQAQLAFIDPNSNYARPYYWAPFILVGNWL